MSSKKKSVVIVEDHPLVREKLADLVNSQPELEVGGVAEDADTALLLIQKTAPDLALVDITLKASSGLALIKKIRALELKTKILVISMHDESNYAQRSISAGASGYITKSRPSEELVGAIRKVLNGDLYLSQEMTLNLMRQLNPGDGKMEPTRTVQRLSDRELEVLEMMGRGCNSRAIARALKVGVATIETYRTRIKNKLNLQNAFELQNFSIRWLRERE